MKLLLLLMLLVVPAFGTGPVLYYSDLSTGMCSTGLNNKGHIVTVNGVNFGASHDASHYVMLIPQAGGSPTTLDAYLLWSSTKIAFQLGTDSGCLSDGDYYINVVTPSGSTADSPYPTQLPIHIYSGGIILFISQTANPGVSDIGSDSNNGLQPLNGAAGVGPKLTLDACRAALAAGVTCYLMPGFLQNTASSDRSGVNFLGLLNRWGSTTQEWAILGYPTSDITQVATIGCDNTNPPCPSSGTLMGMRLENVGNGVVSNLHLLQSPVSGSSASILNSTSYSGHDIRSTNIRVTGTGQGVVATKWGTTKNLKIYGWVIDNLNSITTSSTRTGGFYLGEGLYDVDFGWNTCDSTQAWSLGSQAGFGRCLELHPTTSPNAMGTPTWNGSPTATIGGSLSAGTYDVAISYGQTVYGWLAVPPITPDTPQLKETKIGTVQKITIDGTTQTAISVPVPTGSASVPSSYPGVDSYANMDENLCVPTTDFKVYACREGDVGCDGAGNGLVYQGNSTFTEPTGVHTITASPYLLTTLATGTASPQTSDGTNMSGCFATNVRIHDNLLLNMRGTGMQLNSAKPPIYVYNNVIASVGRDPNVSPYGIYFTDNDNNQIEKLSDISTGNYYVFNNTIYTAGVGFNSACIIYGWASSGYWPYTVGAAYNLPAEHVRLYNNVCYQLSTLYYDGTNSVNPRLNYPNTVFDLQGSANLCKKAGSTISCPAGSVSAWNSGGGGLSSDPLFVSLGTSTPDANGIMQPYFAGINLSLQSTSPAINAGFDTTVAPFNRTRDFNGVVIPQGTSVDMGAYEFVAPYVFSMKGAAKIEGKARVRP